LGWGKSADILYPASVSETDIYVFDLTRVKPSTVDWADLYSATFNNVAFYRINKEWILYESKV
jgi:hypothetical protein